MIECSWIMPKSYGLRTSISTLCHYKQQSFGYIYCQRTNQVKKWKCTRHMHLRHHVHEYYSCQDSPLSFFNKNPIPVYLVSSLLAIKRWRMKTKESSFSNQAFSIHGNFPPPKGFNLSSSFLIFPLVNTHNFCNYFPSHNGIFNCGFLPLQI